MAYNKSKLVESAQKLLNQGKVAQSIAEYQQILKHEPRDQVTLMTVGELYIRQGETFQAIDYFERLAQIFVGDGFLTKAIAVYKRIAKLAPEEIRPLEKLADLYVQQGVMSEARPLFLQLAEIHLKNNRQPEAVALLKKLLLAEPDNLRIQVRLADLYQAMGQTKEAMDAYIAASQRALARGDQAECEKLADKALKLDPNNLAAAIVKARSSSSQGNFAQAAQLLERVPDLEKGGEQTELLLDLYLKNVKWDEAVALALRVFNADEKNFGPAQKVVEALLESGHADKAMPILERTRIPMIDAGEHEIVSRLLTSLAARLPGKTEPLEWLVDTYGRTSDSFRLPDALAQLGDALVATKQLDRAKAVFEQLVDHQPESEAAKRKLNHCLRTMGLLPGEAPPEPVEQAVVQLPEPEAPKVRPGYHPESPEVAAEPLALPEEADEETQKFIAQSLTDVDLFASYGLTQKATGLLEAILRRTPEHIPTLEKLLDFVVNAGDDRRTAELAAQLEKLHQKRGDTQAAERFSELRRRFQRAAGLTEEDLAVAPPVVASVAPATRVEPVAPSPVHSSMEEVAVTPAANEPAPWSGEISASQPAAQEAVHEVDLSDEWSSLLGATSQQDSTAAAETSALPAGAPPLEEFVIGAESQPAPADNFSGTPEFEIPVDAPPSELTPHSLDDILSAAPLGDHSPIAFQEPPTLPAAPLELPEITPSVPAEFGVPVGADHAPSLPPSPSEPEFELEEQYDLVIEPEPLVPAYDQKPPETSIAPPPEPELAAKNASPAGSAFASDQFLSDLANEIDQLGMDQLTPSFSQPASNAPQQTAPVSANSSSSLDAGPLKEVFDEFRAELGEMGADDEDLETHYNLGVAFREMGLVEEAISEFQKVAKATDRGRPFRYTMQCCTLLGLAFIDKGLPGIAAIWYERALLTPGIDAESILALRYDLGVAQESAGEMEAALKSFSQVYAMNIDYRDVADRIAAIQKPIR